MYTGLWTKYLPVIRIIMKRSLLVTQVLPLNAADFERAGMKRKTAPKFSFRLAQGRLNNVIIDLPVASDLASVLLGDGTIRQLLSVNEFGFSLSPRFELTIQHFPAG